MQRNMHMSIKLSYFFADFFIARNWIKKEERLIYIVGLDVIFSTFAQLFIIALIGVWRERIIETIVYLLFFFSVRKYSGGYHASTRIGCMTIFTIAYLLADEFAICLCRIGNANIIVAYGIYTLLVANFIFYLYVPIKNERKRYITFQLSYVRKAAFVCINMWNCPAVAMAFIYPAIAVQIFSATNVVVLLIILCKPWRKGI